MLDILKVPAVIALPQYGRLLMKMATIVDDNTKLADYADLYLKQPEGWQAYNLMGRIALKTLEAKLGKKTAEDRPLERRNLMIIGTNGPGEALALGVQKRAGLVSLCAADDHEAQKAAQATNSRFVPLGKLYETLVDGVITTVRNLDHHTRKTPINPSILRPGMAFMDLTDPPADSPLLVEARERGCKVVEPADIFVDYVTQIFKSLTGNDLPPEAFAAGLG
jgi:3-dehydroquinate dehydratase / shikimate dehydrogenase